MAIEVPDTHSNRWLCVYAIAQLGKPYWYATAGEISSENLLLNRVKPAVMIDLGLVGWNKYSNAADQYNVKVHDCSGLVLGALICNSTEGVPTLPAPKNVNHSATDQYNLGCKKNRNNSMMRFPHIPGTLVFTTNGKYKKHVGIYIGNFVGIDGKEEHDIVVEAKGHDTGVVTSKVSNPKWDCWGQLDCCAVDTAISDKFDARQILDIPTEELSTATKEVQLDIDTKSMTPYVATIAEGAKPNLNFKKLREARVSAVMLFGGQLFNASHQKRTYVNSNLPDLVKQCNDNGMPYGLYVNVRSNSEIEADEECKALYYIISHYPPKLGLWLSVQTGNSKELNDKILEIYYKYINNWGLKSKCGLYLNESQLNSITWTSFKDRFYLWYVDPMDMSEIDDELFNPDMFEVSD